MSREYGPFPRRRYRWYGVGFTDKQLTGLIYERAQTIEAAWEQLLAENPGRAPSFKNLVHEKKLDLSKSAIKRAWEMREQGDWAGSIVIAAYLFHTVMTGADLVKQSYPDVSYDKLVERGMRYALKQMDRLGEFEGTKKSLASHIERKIFTKGEKSVGIYLSSKSREGGGRPGQ